MTSYQLLNIRNKKYKRVLENTVLRYILTRSLEIEPPPTKTYDKVYELEILPSLDTDLELIRFKGIKDEMIDLDRLSLRIFNSQYYEISILVKGLGEGSTLTLRVNTSFDGFINICSNGLPAIWEQDGIKIFREINMFESHLFPVLSFYPEFVEDTTKLKIFLVLKYVGIDKGISYNRNCEKTNFYQIEENKRVTPCKYELLRETMISEFKYNVKHNTPLNASIQAQIPSSAQNLIKDNI